MQGHTSTIYGVLRLPDKQRVISCSIDGSLRVWDLESGTQVGDAWKDEENGGGVYAIALSPDGKKVASGSSDGAVRLWNIDTGKVSKKWMGNTHAVRCICWGPDVERVVSGSDDGTFRVWDVERAKTILGPVKAGDDWVYTVCYSPDGTMIATGGDSAKVWDANTGELLKILAEEFVVRCLAWTLDGKTLMVGMPGAYIAKFDTATWTETAELKDGNHGVMISLSPNERILASPYHKTVKLWNSETNQPIGQPLYHEDRVNCATFSANGKLLATGCSDNHVYTWDISAIVREAGLDDLLSDNVNTVNKPFNIGADATRRQAPQITEIRQLPPVFFDDFSPSRRRRDYHTTSPHQRTLLGRLPSFWRRRRSNPRGETERDTQSPSHPRSLANTLVSSILRRQDGSEIQLQEPPVVDASYTWPKPRNYHARGKKAVRSSRPPNSHTMQQHTRPTQSQSLSSQPQSAAIITSATLPPVTGTAGDTGTMSDPDIMVRQAGWWIRFLLWIGCASVEYMDNQP